MVYYQKKIFYQKIIQKTEEFEELCMLIQTYFNNSLKTL